MDEPLSALDRMTKEEILPYFEALRTALAIPALYVTHDIAEIERLADHMVLLNAGRVVAAGPLNDLLTDVGLPISHGPEASTVLEARIAAFDPQDCLTTLAVDGEELLVPGRAGEIGRTHRVRIAARDVSLAAARPSPTTILNILPVRVRHVEPVDEAQVNVVLTIGHSGGGSTLLARITWRAQNRLRFQSGQNVYAQIKGVSLVASSESAATPVKPVEGS
jgi:molybdate transport system ATP-binding protein